jgi:hypothetical protein
MAYDFNLTQIDNTDTFKEWADKCNAIIDGLNSTDFVTNADGIVTVSSNQTITGRKTFSQLLDLTGGFTTSANYTLGGTAGVINTPTFTVNSGDTTIGSGFQAIGARGISFKASSTADAASIKFENSGTPQKLVFDYAGSGGIFEIGDGNKLALGGSSPTLTVNNYDWNLPATSPGSTASILKWDGSGNNLSWLAESTLANAIVNDVRDILQNSNFTLPVNLIPVGTMIAVDARILDSWDVINSPEEYTIWSGAPGWIPCDGQTLSYDENASPVDTTYQELVELLEGIDSPSGSTTLPDTVGSPGEEDPIGGNAIVYLIKYKSDDTTSFAVSTRTGTAGADGINLFDTSNAEVGSFDIIGGKIGLNINTDDFEFGAGGELSLVEEIDIAATGNTLAKRDSDGTLTVAEPTANGHAATKAYVSQAINDERGSVRAFPELIDGHQAFGGDRNSPAFGMTVVDRYGRGVFGGNSQGNRNGWPSSSYPRGWFNAFSPVTDKEANFERTAITTLNYFFIDSDGIIYGTGSNSYGQIGQRDRGNNTDFTDYYNYFRSPMRGGPYNDINVENPIPAMLPQKTAWPANAVTVDIITHSTTFGGSYPLIVVKTKDGVGNEYVNNDRLQGLKSYQTDSGVPYTRGWLIGASRNSNGALGFGVPGSSAATNYTSTGAVVFGLDSAAKSLWTIFGITDAEREAGITTTISADSTFTGKVNKRFHYYKRNATEAGGLGETNGEALAAWRTELGFTGSETFDDYSYYIKKVVVSNFTSYLLVGKPGNESDNELWSAGWGASGQIGNGTTDTHVRAHVPALQSGRTLSLTISTVAGTSNQVFESTTAHGFEDFEMLKIGTSNTRYYIVRGDENNQNLTTRFRLFPDFQEPRALKAIRDGGRSYAYQRSNWASVALTHYEKLKGIFDISVGHTESSYDYVIARRTVDTTTDSAELDALPESEFEQVTVMSWGRNTNGQLGHGDISTRRVIPRVVSLGTTDRPVDIIAGAETGTSFVITENSDGNRSIYVTGRRGDGLTDVGTTSGSTTSFTKSTTIDSGWWVKKVFVTAGTTWRTGFTGKIWIVVQSKANPDVYALFAGGYNHFTLLGFSGSAIATKNYVRVPFPEDPKNIIAMRSDYESASFALCKTEEDGETAAEFALKSGRMYGCGYALWRFGNTHLGNQNTFHPMDGQVLST